MGGGRDGRGQGLPYKGVPVLLTTWTRCPRCKCVVEHLEQAGHDAWHAQLDALAAGRAGDEPVLEEAS
jgi:hypothetical protein